MGALAFRGPDAVRFLQSQLTADVTQLAPGAALPAAWCNPQGRVLAVLWLLAAPDGLLALMPRALAATTAEGLRRFVLFNALHVGSMALGFVFINKHLVQCGVQHHGRPGL